MQDFAIFSGIAAPLPIANVDTDKIFAGRFLKTVGRTGLGEHLFSGLRYYDDGTERPKFILNRMPWRNASILIALENFGCGSSREHAPWALGDFGIRCVIAPSFADIFYNNCFKNFILPIALPRLQVFELLADAEDPSLCCLQVDLTGSLLSRASGESIKFEIDEYRREALLNGRDDISASLKLRPEIEAWERQAKLFSPPIPHDFFRTDDAYPLDPTH